MTATCAPNSSGRSASSRGRTPRAMPMPISRRWASTMRAVRFSAANAAPPSTSSAITRHSSVSPLMSSYRMRRDSIWAWVVTSALTGGVGRGQCPLELRPQQRLAGTWPQGKDDVVDPAGCPGQCLGGVQGGEQDGVVLLAEEGRPAQPGGHDEVLR